MSEYLEQIFEQMNSDEDKKEFFLSEARSSVLYLRDFIISLGGELILNTGPGMPTISARIDTRIHAVTESEESRISIMSTFIAYLCHSACLLLGHEFHEEIYKSIKEDLQAEAGKKIH